MSREQVRSLAGDGLVIAFRIEGDLLGRIDQPAGNGPARGIPWKIYRYQRRESRPAPVCPGFITVIGIGEQQPELGLDLRYFLVQGTGSWIRIGSLVSQYACRGRSKRSIIGCHL